MNFIVNWFLIRVSRQYNGEKMVLSTNELRQLAIHMEKNVKWVIDLNVKASAIKLSEKNTGVHVTMNIKPPCSITSNSHSCPSESQPLPGQG